MIKARTLVFSILVVIAVPTIAWGDEEDKLECEILVMRGEPCIEMVWEEGGQVMRGSWVDCRDANDCPRGLCGCRCNRHAYQDFGVGERIKYQWCKARY